MNRIETTGLHDVDDVTITDVSMFHLEVLNNDCVWVGVYHGDTKEANRTTFHIKGNNISVELIEKGHEDCDLDSFLKVLHAK